VAGGHPAGLQQIEKSPAEKQRPMDVHDRRGMEVSRRQARPVRGDEAKEGNEDEYAPHHHEKASRLNPRSRALHNGRFHGSLPDQYFARQYARCSVEITSGSPRACWTVLTTDRDRGPADDAIFTAVIAIIVVHARPLFAEN